MGSNNAVEEYLEKRAGFGSLIRGIGHGAQRAIGESIGLDGPQGLAKTYRVGRGLGGTAMSGALGVAGAGAASLGVLAVQKAYDAATKARDFKSMLEYAPDVMAMHQEDPKAVSQMFSTLRVFNPDFTRDPVVASSYVRRMVAEPMGAGGIATEALQSREKIKHPLADSVVKSVIGGGKKK